MEGNVKKALKVHAALYWFNKIKTHCQSGTIQKYAAQFN
jgi:hypothetical protein